MIKSETITLAGKRKSAIYKTVLNEKAVRELIDRVTYSSFNEHFLFEQIEEIKTGFDRFVLSTAEGKIKIAATNTNAAAIGFNWYLKHYLHCNISPLTKNVLIDENTQIIFPETSEEQQSPFLYRYFLNYCTYSYTMAFWQWENFERLIDFMALSGVNLALNVVGHEAVIRDLLLRYNYSKQEIDEYICGPAYFAWQWMNNIMGFCGPLPEWWYEERTKLAQKINSRFNELGIEVMLPAFCGSVPPSFKEKHRANTVTQGTWTAYFQRPDLLLPEDDLFFEMATEYYTLLEKVNGIKASFFSTDPFHEGGNEEGIDKEAWTLNIRNTMKQYNKNAVWVFQGWISNPRREMLSVMPKDDVLITDLMSDLVPAFSDEHDDFLHYPYTLGQVNNFGGQRNYRGHFMRSLSTPFEALESEKAQGMCGIGLLMEGIEDVEIFYDLFGDISFRQKKPEIDEWLTAYAKRRYGCDDTHIVRSLEILTKKVLICTEKPGSRESVFLARPGMAVDRVSTWTANWCAYKETDLIESLELLFESYDICKNNESYQLDLTDLARQALANYGWEIVYKVINKDHFEENTALFLKMILMQDSLMSSIKRTSLSHWIEMARAIGRTVNEKDLFEKNARYLISIWSDKENEYLFHDYAAREWGGILKSFYYKRWALFFDALRNGEDVESINWYEFELQFADSTEYCEEVPPKDKKQLIEDIIDLVKGDCK